MTGFLKVFVRGLVCLVLLPFILLVWVLYGVYCLITFIVMFFKSVISFFAGENPTGDLKEDIEAKRILLEEEQAKVEQAEVMTMVYQNLANQQNMMQQNQPTPTVEEQALTESEVFDAPVEEENSETNEEGGNE